MAEERNDMDMDPEMIFTDEEGSNESAETGTGLTELEFRFLCASFGITTLVGYEIPPANETDEEQMQGLLNMVKHGLLIREEDSFVVNEELGEMMECIATRICTMQIWSPESDVSNCVIYIGEDKAGVVAKPGQKEGEYTVLTYLPEGTLPAFLSSADIIPEAMIPEEIAEFSRELDKEGISVPEGELTDKDGVRLEIRFYDGTDAEESVIFYVLWLNEQELIVRDIGGVRTADHYVTNEIIPLICAQCGLGS